jgi:hypothetical protein
MKLWKIGISCACAAAISVAAVVWWVHREKPIEWKKLADAASETRARAGRGDVTAEFELARIYYEGKGVPRDYGEAIRWYGKAADHGYTKAQFNLGNLYYRGQGVPRDYSEAIRWYRRAADQGDVKGQDALGYAYYNGEGVPQEYSEAVRWYRRAADQGYYLAQQALGDMYAKGQGVPQDDTEAVVWYRKAAEQGDAVGQRSLGYMYASGRGVPQDRIEAGDWYRKAADQGDAYAKRALESLGSGPRPPIRTRYIELSLAVLGFSVGLWFSLDFLLPGRRLRNWRQTATTLLGVTFLLNAGLSLYAFAHDIRFSPYHDSFHLARRFLVPMAILLIVTVVLSAKRRPN